MATSSIFENFTIETEESALRLVTALEEAEKNPKREISTTISELETDSKKICELFGVSEEK